MPGTETRSVDLHGRHHAWRRRGDVEARHEGGAHLVQGSSVRTRTAAPPAVQKRPVTIARIGSTSDMYQVCRCTVWRHREQVQGGTSNRTLLREPLLLHRPTASAEYQPSHGCLQVHAIHAHACSERAHACMHGSAKLAVSTCHALHDKLGHLAN